MTDRILIKDAIVLTQDPDAGRAAASRHPRRGRHDRRRRAEPAGSRRRRSSTPRATSSSRASSTPTATPGRRRSGRAPRTTRWAPTSAAILDKFAPNYRPDDVYAANRWGAIECANAGITTLVDWSHIMNTPDHADAGDPGPPGRPASGRCSRSASRTRRSRTWWFGPDCAGSVLDDRRRRGPPPPQAVLQLRRPGLITMALATRGTNFCREEVVRYEWELAKELGLNITVHVAMYRFGYTKMQLPSSRRWTSSTRTRPTSTRRTCSTTSGRWSATPAATSRSRRRSSSRWATAGRRRSTASDYGVPIGLSSDVATTASSDQFTQMHAIFASERARRYEIAWDENLEWDQPESKLITSRHVLAMATIGGAKVAGIADRIGSITPGKKADLVIIDGHAVNVAPVIDPVGGGRLRGRRLERRHGDRRRHDPQARRQARSPISSGPRQRVKASRDYLSARSTSPSRAGCRRQSPPSHVIKAGRPGGRPAGSARPSAARVGVAPSAGPARRPRRALRQMPRSRSVSSRARATRRRWAAGRSTGVPSAASSLRP